MSGGYENQEMSRAVALNIAGDVGLLMSVRTPDGGFVPQTARVELRPRGKGYDLLVPAELFDRLYQAGFQAGKELG